VVDRVDADRRVERAGIDGQRLTGVDAHEAGPVGESALLRSPVGGRDAFVV